MYRVLNLILLLGRVKKCISTIVITNKIIFCVDALKKLKPNLCSIWFITKRIDENVLQNYYNDLFNKNMQRLFKVVKTSFYCIKYPIYLPNKI